MIPIPTQPDEGMAFPEECEDCHDLAEDDKGCPRCQVLYSLNVRGPSADSDEPFRVVRAGDLTNVSDPVFDISEEMKSIPITYLAQGQFLEFIAFATLGRGRDHAKWSAASAVTFQPRYEAELKKPKRPPFFLILVLRQAMDELSMRNSSPARSAVMFQPFSILKRHFIKLDTAPAETQTLTKPSSSTKSMAVTSSRSRPMDRLLLRLCSTWLSVN